MKQYPRWLIDDTTGISDARVFIAHMQTPRFIGELMPDDEADIDGITLEAPFHQTVCRIEWFDEPVFDADELCRSMAEAIRHCDSIRNDENPYRAIELIKQLSDRNDDASYRDAVKEIIRTFTED